GHAVYHVEQVSLLLADYLQGNVPFMAAPFVVDNADLIVWGELLDGELGDLLFPAVAVLHLAGVHDQHQPALGLDLERFDVAIDRQRLLNRRALPTAGAEAVGTADHDQAAALVKRVAAE